MLSSSIPLSSQPVSPLAALHRRCSTPRARADWHLAPAETSAEAVLCSGADLRTPRRILCNRFHRRRIHPCTGSARTCREPPSIEHGACGHSGHSEEAQPADPARLESRPWIHPPASLRIAPRYSLVLFIGGPVYVTFHDDRA